MPSAFMKSRMNGYLEESEIMQELRAMLEDASYRTMPGYSNDIDTYPNNAIPFVEEHLSYLKRHPQVNPAHYLANLRIMLKIR
jgi:hypothetical protein